MNAARRFAGGFSWRGLDSARDFALDLAMTIQDLGIDPDDLDGVQVRAIAATIVDPRPAWRCPIEGKWADWHSEVYEMINDAFMFEDTWVR